MGVYIDELDELRSGGAGGKDMRLGVQHALLKMIEGTTCNVPQNGSSKNPMEPGIPIDTTNILFVRGGAFGGLEEVIARRQGRGAFGFDRPDALLSDSPTDLLRQVLLEDLERFGPIPELLGRLPVIATLADLSVVDLVRFLQEPTKSFIGHYTSHWRITGSR